MCLFNFIGKKLRRLLREELCCFYRKEVMSTIVEVIDSVHALNVKLVDVKTKLDAIKDLVTALEGGQVASQEQIDALAQAVSEASDTVDSVSTEEDSVK